MTKHQIAISQHKLTLPQHCKPNGFKIVQQSRALWQGKDSRVITSPEPFKVEYTTPSGKQKQQSSKPR